MKKKSISLLLSLLFLTLLFVKQADAVAPNNVVVHFTELQPKAVAKGSTYASVIQAYSSVDVPIRRYNFKVNFDKTKLKVTGISYLFGTVDADGDTSSKVSAINQAGVVKVIGKTSNINGKVLSATNLNDIVKITFKVIATGANDVTVEKNGGLFYKYDAATAQITSLEINTPIIQKVNSTDPVNLLVCGDLDTEGVNGCSFTGGDGIQRAIDVVPVGKATIQSTINIKAGNYSRQSSNVFSTSDKYFLSTNSKHLKLIGQGEVVLRGDISAPMSGIRIPGGTVDIKSLTVQGFKKDSAACSQTGVNCNFKGSGIKVVDNATVNILGSKIINNDATGIYYYTTNTNSLPVKVENCLIYGNRKQAYVYTTTCTDCKNRYGGGIHGEYNTNLRLINNVIYGNFNSGVKVYRPTGYTPKVEMRNNIFTTNKKWGTAEGGYGFDYIGKETTTNLVFYNNLFYANEIGCSQDTLRCSKNFSLNNTDPKFVNATGFNFKLINDDNNKSSAIDAGDPNIKDIDNSISDIGAYGGPNVCILDSSLSGCSGVSPTVTVGPSPTPDPVCAKKSKGDANCDNNINLIDFEIWRSELVGTATTKNADFNSDGNVSLIDFEIWRSNIGG